MTEQVNNPDHYNSYSVEVIDMMISIWGKEKVAIFCELNAFKYRMRAGRKGSVKIDLEKEQWYLNMLHELNMRMIKERVEKERNEHPTHQCRSNFLL